jgi:hypothetical protein
VTEYEVEMRLGYTPCICGVIDGTWHPECYKVNRTGAEREAAHKRAFAAARRHLKAEGVKEIERIRQGARA